MYPIKAPAVYIHQRVMDSPKCMERMERMMGCIESTEPPRVVNDEELDAISKEHNWPGIAGKRTGEIKRIGNPAIIFNRFRWVEADEIKKLKQRFPNISGYYFLGDGAWGYRNGRATLQTQHGICQNAYVIHSAWGCLHSCDYCNIGNFLNIMLDIEELIEHLDGLIKANPWLKLYKYDNHTDIPTFEPEYGASKLLVEYFAQRQDDYLMLYTKSDNVDYLTNYKHQGHTIICWTLSCSTVTREIEKDSPSMENRIAAARLCQDAGYTVRVRFSPIIPIKNWREESEDMLEKYLSAVRPDIITMDMFKWIEPRKVRDIFDVSLWDEEYLDYVDKYAAMDPDERPRGILPNGKQVFPHDARARVYSFFINKIREINTDVRIALCGETPEMWDEMDPELGMTPDNYVCACGPTSVPGNPLLSGG